MRWLRSANGLLLNPAHVVRILSYTDPGHEGVPPVHVLVAETHEPGDYGIGKRQHTLAVVDDPGEDPLLRAADWVALLGPTLWTTIG